MFRPTILLSTLTVLLASGCAVALDELPPEPGDDVDLIDRSDFGDLSNQASDTIPPTTTILSGPDWQSFDPVVRFEFAADEAATFECRLDDGEFAACSSPQEYSALQPGAHRFQVRAVDLTGNVEPSPADWPWRGCYEISAEIAAAATVSMCSVTGNKAPLGRLLALADPEDEEFQQIVGWTGFDLSSLPDDLIATQMILHLHHQNGWANPLGDPAAIVQHSSANHWVGSVVTRDELFADATVSVPTDQYETASWNDFTIELKAFSFRADLARDWITLGIADISQRYSYVIFYTNSVPALGPSLEVDGYSCQPSNAR